MAKSALRMQNEVDGEDTEVPAIYGFIDAREAASNPLNHDVFALLACMTIVFLCNKDI